MRFVLDLRLRHVHDQERPEPTRVRARPQDLAAIASQPRRLYGLLRGRRYESVRVLGDDLPFDGVQAVAMLLVSLASADRFEVARGGSLRSYGPASFRAYAAGSVATALPLELVRTALELLYVRRRITHPVRLAPDAKEIDSVLYLHRPASTMGSGTGGAATHTAGVIAGFQENRLAVEIIGPDRPDQVAASAFRRVPLRRRFHLVEWLTVSHYSRQLADAAEGSAAGVVYERSIAGSYAGREVSRRLNLPFVLEFNGSDAWIAEHWGGRHLPFQGTVKALERANLLSASLVVVLSRALADHVIAAGVPAERVLTNPVGVDVDGLAALREGGSARWRAETGLPEAPTVAFIGTFGRWHGADLLPSMIERAAVDLPETRWLLIGAGPLHRSVSAEIEARGLGGRTTMTGMVDRDRAMELLAAADVCVSPHVPNPDGSRFFGSPMKLFEYMGLGKAIVASDLEQLGEVIDDGRNGLLVPPGDPQAAAAAVCRLLKDADLRRRLGDAALADAEADYTWSAHTRRILDAISGTDREKEPTGDERGAAGEVR